MSPFDISVMMFFMVIVIKAIHDTFEFWKEMDEREESLTPSMSPKHLPAPTRPAPNHITPVASPVTAAPAKIQPLRRPKPQVRPAVVASREVAIRPVSAPIKKATAAKKTTVA